MNCKSALHVTLFKERKHTAGIQKNISHHFLYAKQSKKNLICVDKEKYDQLSGVSGEKFSILPIK